MSAHIIITLCRMVSKSVEIYPILKPFCFWMNLSYDKKHHQHTYFKHHNIFFQIIPLNNKYKLVSLTMLKKIKNFLKPMTYFFSFGCIFVFTIITYRYIITLEDDSYILDTKVYPKLSNSLQFLFHNNFLGGLRPKISGSLEIYKFNKRVVSSL